MKVPLNVSYAHFSTAKKLALTPSSTCFRLKRSSPSAVCTRHWHSGRKSTGWRHLVSEIYSWQPVLDVQRADLRRTRADRFHDAQPVGRKLSRSGHDWR